MIAPVKLSIVAALALASIVAAHAETVAIVHARAWTLTSEAPVEDATIVVTDGKIMSVAAGGSAPAAARILDAKGRPATPGLMNAASQLGLVEVGAASETVDHTIKPGVPGQPGAGFDVQYAVNPNSSLIQVARTDGLARAVSYPGGSGVAPFSGSGALLHLLERGDIVERPRIGVFVSIGNRSASTSVGSRAAQWQSLRNALDTAKAAAATPPAKGAVKSADSIALENVISGKTPLAISTHRASDLRQSASLARDYGIRVIVLGGTEAWMVADELAAAKVAVVLNPTTNLPYSFDELGARLDNAALLSKAGVTIAMTLDGVQSYNAGSSLREGAGLAVANGLPYIEGLRAIISSPAKIWGVDDRSGTLAPGMDGDLVLWDGDPLEPSTLPTAVLMQGREVSLVTHQTRLRDRYLPLLPR
jgi:imidazolonepropionase-like amidohydrolase